MSVRLRFDFWHIESRADVDAIMAHVLETCSSMKEGDSERNLYRNSKVVRLQRVEKHGALWFGDFVGIGTKRGAKKADTTGHLEMLQFEDEEGLGEESAFLYDPTTRVLILQSNRLAATPASVIFFFQKIALGMGAIDLLPVMNQSGLDQFSRFQSVSSFRVGIAKMNLGTAFANKDHSAARLAGIAEELDAPRINLEVTVGRAWRKRGLSLEGLTQMVSELFSAKNSVELQKLEVTGKTEDDDFEALDLMTQRLSDISMVEPDEGRGVTRGLRWHLMQEAYGRNEEYIKRHFRK